MIRLVIWIGCGVIVGCVWWVALRADLEVGDRKNHRGVIQEIPHAGVSPPYVEVMWNTGRRSTWTDECVDGTSGRGSILSSIPSLSENCFVGSCVKVELQGVSLVFL